MTATATSTVIELPLSGGIAAKINADDLERRLFTEFRDGFLWEGRICDRSWKPHFRGHTTYAVSLVQQDRKIRELVLHRLIACARSSDLIDHEDGNGLHNWRTNLRFATGTLNARNRRGAANSTSQFRGVALHRQTGRFEACIRIDRKKKYLGLFESEVDAALAYDRAAIAAWGREACVNFPIESKG